MMKVLVPIAAAVGLMVVTPRVEAMPLAGLSDADGPQITLIYGGCGPFSHRGPYGGCRPGGQWGGYGFGRACPVGFHLGPYGRHCWPN